MSIVCHWLRITKGKSAKTRVVVQLNLSRYSMTRSLLLVIGSPNTPTEFDFLPWSCRTTNGRALTILSTAHPSPIAIDTWLAFFLNGTDCLYRRSKCFAAQVSRRGRSGDGEVVSCYWLFFSQVCYFSRVLFNFKSHLSGPRSLSGGNGS